MKNKFGNMNVPVNKGHFQLDTDERIQLFQKKMAHGWDAGKYFEYRKAWAGNPQNKIVADYPLQIDVELSSKCNLSCPMCYTTTKQFNHVPRDFLDFNLFKKIIDEVAGKIYALRLSWRGESTLHPRFVDAISYAKKKGIKEVSFLTNLSTLDMEYFIKIAKAGADWISVSIDGLDEKYESVRKPLRFQDTLNKIQAIHEYKKHHGMVKPTIKVQTVWPAIRDCAERYYNTFASITDLVAFNPLIDYLGKDHDIVYENNFCCPQLYERIFISSTGKAMMCNSDEYEKHIIGDVKKQSIHEIWHGEVLNRIRDLHNKPNGFMQMEICRKCFYPRKMEVTEQATINGRKILIENYINRNQEIGE